MAQITQKKRRKSVASEKSVEVRLPFPYGGLRQWTAVEAALLGRMSDAAVAAQVGCTRQTVMRERRRRGIAAYRAENCPTWIQELRRRDS